eukprot:8467729-Pyramimonas_sp.AAC.1
MHWVHGDAQLANSLTKWHELVRLRMYFAGGHCLNLVRDAKCRGARKRKAAGVLSFENVPQDIVKSSESSRGPAAGVASEDPPDYEALSSDDSYGDNMFSLEGPYPCRSGSEQA